MATGKRYYWLKLKEDFFTSKRIKKLRRLAGGDTYTIIYLKMQLLSVRNGGEIQYSGLEKTFADELALDLDENPDDVAVTLQFLRACGLLETSDEVNFLLPCAAECIGSESAGTQRVRNFREREKVQKALQCNANETQVKRIGNADIESREKREDKEIEKECLDAAKPHTRTFQKPTIEEVRKYCEERGNKVDAERFVNYYTSNGWKVGRNPMRDWKAAVRTWEKKDARENQGNVEEPTKRWNVTYSVDGRTS